MKIKYIVPYPVDAAGLALRASQIPTAALDPTTVVDAVTVRNVTLMGPRHYADLIFDMYITEVGLAEADGYDAIVMDTLSDSALFALRSRLSIPVIGPGAVAFSMAALLGKRFSIITMRDIGAEIYHKVLSQYDLGNKCASVRIVDVPSNVVSLLTGKEHTFGLFLEQAQLAIQEDRADVLIVGSTTMHQIADYLRERVPVPVISGGSLAIKLAEMFVSLGLSHSKVAFPSPERLYDDAFLALVGLNPPDDHAGS
jgi:allantoin racemase